MSANLERHLTGNLRWLENGSVLASWQLAPLQRPRSQREAATVARAHRELFRALSGHRFWLESLLIWTDPSEIATAMIAGVDLQQNPSWAQTTDDAIDMLTAEGLGRRRFLLSAKLNLPAWLTVKSAALAAANDCFERMSMSVLPPDEQLVRFAAAQARTIARAIPKQFNARPLTATDVVWSRRHAWARHGSDLVDPQAAPELAEEMLQGSRGLGRVHLDPNGMSTATATQRATAAVKQRWIAVSDDLGNTSYQAGMVIANIPRHLQWPDTEFLGRIDDCGVPVDLTITGVVRSSAEAKRKSEHAMKQLGDQTRQVNLEGGDGTDQASHQVRLDDATQIALDYTTELTRDKTLVEIEPVLIVSVAADSPEQVELQAQAYLDADVNKELTIARPISQEEALFWARQPGGVPSPEVSSYRQLSHSAGGLGQSAVLTSCELGDDTGIPIVVNEGSALRSLSYLEPFGRGSAYRKKSPSMATIGDQGGGKTFFAKTFAGHMVDRGARLVATDTSSEGEWVTFANSLGTSVQVVDFENPTCSIDPLRTLPIKMGAPVLQSYLSTLLDIDATGDQGRLLAKTLKSTYLAKYGIDSSGALVQHLARMTKKTADTEGLDVALARQLADRVGVFADPDQSEGIARVIFDPTLPALDTTAQCQIWRMVALQLPSDTELTNVRLFDQMGIQKRLGRASYALYAKFVHELCLADKSTPALQNIDEFHHVHSSPEALKAVEEYLRMHRHCDAFFHGQSQLPSDFFHLGDLIRTRLVLRLSTEDAALEAAAFLGKQAHDDPSKENAEDNAERYALAQEILEHNADGDGRGMMRDHRGRVAPVRTLLPFSQHRRLAADTTRVNDEIQVVA